MIDELTALRQRVHSLYTERDEARAELAEAQAALWRIQPNTHTVPCELNNFQQPDPFEGPGETYRDAYERIKTEALALLETAEPPAEVGLDEHNAWVDRCNAFIAKHSGPQEGKGE